MLNGQVMGEEVNGRLLFYLDIIFIYMCMYVHAQSCPTLQPHGLQPTRLLSPWDFPGKNTGVDCHFLLLENLPNPGIKLMSLASPSLAGTGRFFTTEPPPGKSI